MISPDLFIGTPANGAARGDDGVSFGARANGLEFDSFTTVVTWGYPRLHVPPTPVGRFSTYSAVALPTSSLRTVRA